MPSPENRIDHAVIAFAGGDTGILNASCGTPGHTSAASQEAAILILGQPARAFVTNTTVRSSAKNGIERAWSGTPISFTETNAFEDVPFCAETFPRPLGSSCPTPAPCSRPGG